MNKLRAFLAIAISLTFGSFGQESSSTTDEVRIHPVGPYGEVLTDCTVDRFLAIGKSSGRDYKTHFNGLLGRDIPFGEYQVLVRCKEPSASRAVASGVGTTLRLDRTRKFVVVSSHRFLGHIMPNLSVRVENSSSKSQTRWVKLVGVYLDESSVAPVTGDPAVADIDGIVPGDYVLFLLEAGKLVCSRPVRVLNFLDYLDGQSLTIDVAQGCSIRDTKGVVNLGLGP